jgi:hypothetical protein
VKPLPLRRAFALCLFVTSAALASCGGPGEIGDTCSTPGSREECIDDAVCEKLQEGDLQCLLVCVDQADCPEDFDCNGTSGTNIKSCHPQTIQP